MPNTRNIPWRLVLAYALDWLLLLAIAAVGGGLSYIPPYKRTFSLSDLAISYPYRNSVISTGLLVFLSLILPAIVIVLVAGIFCPWPTARKSMSSRRFWGRKIWEINAGLMGLGLSYVLALLLTQMVKNLFGKPRPDLLSRCMPDLSNITAYIVGGDGMDIAKSWSMVDVRICTNTDKSVMDDGFRSFFSGHSSSAFSGLLYLALWLAAKLDVSLPFVQPYTAHDLELAASGDHTALPISENQTAGDMEEGRSSRAVFHRQHTVVEQYRQSGAAVPIYGYIFILLPILLAIYIASTRYQEFKHAGVDITVGSLVGSAFAVLGYRSYHSSLTKGCAWTWAPRSEEHAFAVSTSIAAKTDPRRRQGGAMDQSRRKNGRSTSTNGDPEQRLTEAEEGINHQNHTMEASPYAGRGI